MESPTLQAYTPHLKRVLKSYQEAAMSSLHGPNSFMSTMRQPEVPAAAKVDSEPAAAGPPAPPPPPQPVSGGAAAKSTPTVEKKKLAGKFSTNPEYDPFLAPPPFPIQQPPLFTPPDQSRCERSETILEGETISCFVVGGEKRLCLPQILNTVLRDFSLQQINNVCDELQIFCSRCNSEQLDVLKVTGILPFSAPSCGLITKTDAERLCAALLNSNPPKVDRDIKSFQFKVYHECFGKCNGRFHVDLYVSPVARCIECAECHGLFPPQKFVCHAHGGTENHTCHWGFDSANWRAYLLLEQHQDNYEELQEVMTSVKEKFDYSQKFKRKQTPSEESNNKKVRNGEEGNFALPCVAFGWDPALWYSQQWARASAFKPWTPVTAKDRKSQLASPQSNLPHYIHENAPVVAYLSAEPPEHQNPERVVLKLSSDRLDKYYQPDIALVTPPPHLKQLSKKLHREAYAADGEPAKAKGSTVAVQREKGNSKSPEFTADAEETLSNSSLSTLSGIEDAFTGNHEDEESLKNKDELSGLKKILDQHKLEDNVQSDILQETRRIITGYQQLFNVITRKKKLLQKEVKQLSGTRHCKLLPNEKSDDCHSEFPLCNPLGIQLILKQEPKDLDENDSIQHRVDYSPGLVRDERMVNGSDVHHLSPELRSEKSKLQKENVPKSISADDVSLLAPNDSYSNLFSSTNSSPELQLCSEKKVLVAA